MERKKKKWDNTSCYNRRQTHITREKNRVRKRSHIHKACIQRAERGRENTLIFTSAQRQGQLSLSLAFSFSVRQLEGALTTVWQLNEVTVPDMHEILNHWWQTLNCSTCVGSCVSEREGEQNSSLFPSTSLLACHGRFTSRIRIKGTSQLLSFALSFSKSLFTL